MVHPISNIIFSYIKKSGKNTESNRTLVKGSPSIEVNNKLAHNFNNMNLPISMNPGEYGEIVLDNYVQIDGESIHRFIVVNGSRTYRIDISNDGLTNTVTILGAINLTWVDTSIDKTNNIFVRVIKKSTIYFMDGVVVLKKQILNAKPFKSLKVDSGNTSNFFTLDIETIRNSNGKLSPYLICAYNGKDYITSFGSDQNSLFKSFMDQFLSKIESGKTTLIYAHNLSNFDGIFLLRHLIAYCQSVNCDYGKVEPLIFHGKIISVKVKVGTGKNQKTIIFKDSYLLLPLSLRFLCKAFEVSVHKGYFPFLLSNIYYSGVLPALEFWTKITPTIYESILSEYKGKRMWNFQLESIKYCKLDCQSLYEVIVKFNELIFNEFKIDSHTVLTLPSLAMKIYKSHYMPADSIYQLLGKVEEAIRESYSGGAVDVYIPHNRISSFFSKVKAFFITLYYYDVNSLYPYVMANTPMPVGRPIAFSGDIRKIDPNAYGFFYCKITSPDNLLHPLLQRKIKTVDGWRTVAGLGSWHGWINSIEMDNALKYGYQFEILNGYQFETGDLFSAYVAKMYNLRLEYAKGTPMNLIAKLLMNSLYGKFGMRMETTIVDIYDTSTDDGLLFKEILNALGETLTDYLKIDKSYVIVRDSRLSMKYDEKDDMYHGQDINIAVASAITAGARVHMSYFKNNPLFNLYYSDTDSSVTDQPLPQHMIGSEIGQVKLEHIINKAIFLAPKVYGLVDIDGNEIIKVKGITSDIASQLHIEDLENLLVKDSKKEFTQEKWYKKQIEGEITIQDTMYTLKVTSNKRAPLYLYDDGIEIYSNTRPYNYDEFTSK